MNGNILTNNKINMNFKSAGLFYSDVTLGTFDSGVTHWMPIPSFDEILEANRDVLEWIKEKGD